MSALFSLSKAAKRQQKKRALALACLLSLSVFWAGSARAGALEGTAILSQRGEWDTNPLMLSHGAGETIVGSVTTPEVSLKDSTPTSALEATVKLEQKLYDKSAYNTTNVYANGAYETKRLNWLFRLPVETAYDTTRTSEITTFGRDLAQSRHLEVGTTPSLGYALSQRTLFNLEGSLTRSTYEKPDYTNYHEESVTPGLQLGLAPDLLGFFSVKANRYQAEEGLKSRVDSLRPMVGVTSYLTKITSLQVSGGAEAAKQSYEAFPLLNSDSWIWSGVYSAALTMKGEINQLTLSASYERQPYADGTDSLLSSYEGKYSHTFNAALSGNIGATYQKNDQDGKSTNNLDSQIIGDIGLSYAFSKQLRLETHGLYRRQRLTGDDGIAKETVATLGLVLTPTAERLFK